jgi:ferric-dicitrate binding protein FerR (iron transport regulator)
MNSALEKAVREARESFGTHEARHVDWESVDRSLFERIEKERKAERARFASKTRRWPTVAIAVAAAAVVFAVAARDVRRSQSYARAHGGGDDAVAGSIVSIDGAEALVDGRPADRGTSLRLGDVVEAPSARVDIERAGKVTLRLERGSRATVTHVQGALVLALAQGAVEAQVVPVASGEAFAVDVDGSRVAVHGTHLRVERSGDRVVVDLSEGVVSLGAAPRLGSVLGTLVTAPAHAEFLASDAIGTLQVSHDPATLRVPVVLASEARPATPSSLLLPASPKAEVTPPRAGSAVAGAARPEVHAPQGAIAASAAVAPELSPEQSISGAVRACMAERPSSENVKIVVSTTLHLELGDDGAVRAARFDPPVAPDVNGCAAPLIYRTHFSHGGTATIDIDFQN